MTQGKHTLKDKIEALKQMRPDTKVSQDAENICHHIQATRNRFDIKGVWSQCGDPTLLTGGGPSEAAAESKTKESSLWRLTISPDWRVTFGHQHITFTTNHHKNNNKKIKIKALLSIYQHKIKLWIFSLFKRQEKYIRMYKRKNNNKIT